MYSHLKLISVLVVLDSRDIRCVPTYEPVVRLKIASFSIAALNCYDATHHHFLIIILYSKIKLSTYVATYMILYTANET